MEDQVTLPELRRIGEAIAAQRKAFRIATQAIAERANVSRVTLHRIERGEPSVNMGAYMRVSAVLGLTLAVTEQAPSDTEREIPPIGDCLPLRIELSDYPVLSGLAWHLPHAEHLSPIEAWSLYDRNRRHWQLETLTPQELGLVKTLEYVLVGVVE